VPAAVVVVSATVVAGSELVALVGVVVVPEQAAATRANVAMKMVFLMAPIYRRLTAPGSDDGGSTIDRSHGKTISLAGLKCFSVPATPGAPTRTLPVSGLMLASGGGASRPSADA
jgi:hypothetical protein